MDCRSPHRVRLEPSWVLSATSWGGRYEANSSVHPCLHKDGGIAKTCVRSNLSLSGGTVRRLPRRATGLGELGRAPVKEAATRKTPNVVPWTVFRCPNPLLDLFGLQKRNLRHVPPNCCKQGNQRTGIMEGKNVCFPASIVWVDSHLGSCRILPRSLSLRQNPAGAQRMRNRMTQKRSNWRFPLRGFQKA